MTEPIADGRDFADTLRDVRTWYNHDRSHDHLLGRTPAEVWAVIDVFAPYARPERGIQCRSQADERAGEEQRAEQVLSVQMVDTPAWNEREEHKEEVEPEESRSEASRKQSAMRR